MRQVRAKSPRSGRAETAQLLRAVEEAAAAGVGAKPNPNPNPNPSPSLNPNLNLNPNPNLNPLLGYCWGVGSHR